MRALLDTHVLWWLFTAPDRIRKPTLEFLGDPGNDLLWSSVGTTELAIKVSRRRVKLGGGLAAFMEERREEVGFHHLPVEHRHALVVADLPLLHLDPFDRLLVAQAKVEGVPLVSCDTVLRKYGIEVIW